jgi:hypothetical protein
VLLGNSGLVLDEAKGIVLHDYADFPLPASAHPLPLCAEDARLIETTLSVYGQVVEEVVFVASLARDVVSNMERPHPLEP